MIAVTGSQGFIGYHLVRLLEQEGRAVRAGMHYSTLCQGEWAGDVTDPIYCDRLIKGCSVCYHLAAIVEIPYSYKSVKPFVDTNVLGTYNILEACKRHKCKLVHVSSSEVYGSAQYLPMDEKHPLHAQSPYAATKIAADQLVQSYMLSYHLDATIIRPFNTYGPGQSFRAFIPHAIYGFLHPPLSVGLLTTWRDYTYVTDTARGIMLGENGARDVYNLGTGNSISMGGVIDWLSEIMDMDPEMYTHNIDKLRPKASEVMRLESDNSKARVELGWEPSVSMGEGLEMTVEWYREHIK